MAKLPQTQGSAPAPQQAGGEGEGAEFFAPETGGYKRTQDGGPGPDMPPLPSPQTPPPQAAPPPQASAPVDMSSPKEAGKLLATTVVSAVVDRLKAVANARGGHLTIGDLDGMQSEFDRQAEALSGVFEQSFEVYVKARERASWDQQRNYPFDRLMVKKFSHLFKEGDALGPDEVSRRILPGFFVALGMMLGPEVVEGYQEKCRGIVERVKGNGKGVFNWEAVYKDTEAKALILEAEISLAGYFEDLEKRTTWFLNLVNANLTPVDSGAEGPAAYWEFNEVGFLKFLNALLSGLREHLETDNGKMWITKRYGADTCANLFDILKHVQQ